MATHRGFAGVEDHDAWLLDRWNSVVSKRDTVWVLGDVSMNAQKGVDWMAKANGLKYLVAGNHDRCHPVNSRWHSEQRRYLEVFLGVTTVASMKIADHKVMMSHFPYDVDHVPESRFMEWRCRDEGLWLLHGHTHSAEKQTGDRQIHVGVDAWNGYPISRSVIEALLP
jgi:calcineurin-like phosphoesterase family protein